MWMAFGLEEIDAASDSFAHAMCAVQTTGVLPEPGPQACSKCAFFKLMVHGASAR